MNQPLNIDRRGFKLLQAIFWTCFFVFHFLYFLNFNSWQNAVLFGVQQTGFFMAAVYFHLAVLFPIFYVKRKLVLYLLATLVFVAFITFIKQSVIAWVLQNANRTFTARLPSYIYQCFTCLVAIAISALIKFTVDYLKLKDTQQKIEKEKLVSELHFLKQQIQPHFLFNTLNSLLYLTEERSELAPVVVKKLAELMRYLLDKNKTEKASLGEELNFIKAYMDLEKLRIPHVKIEMNVDGKTSDKFIPSLLFLPLIENAFKHGIDKAVADNYVFLGITAEHNYGEVVVKNIAYKELQADGNGLCNLRKRLKLIYNNDYSFSINRDAKMYTAHLKVPYV